MSLLIYEMAHSPFCIPITAALRACGAEFETREASNWDRREILRLTEGAYSQVPVLVHDDRTIFESDADTQDVARYVDGEFAQGALFPEPLEGLQAIVLEFIENEIEARTFKLVDPHYLQTIGDVAERGMIIRHKERKFGRGCVEQWRRDAAQIRAEADRLLARFESTLWHAAFLFGTKPVFSDFALLGVLGNLTWNGWNALHPEKQCALIRWQQALRNFRYQTR